MTGIRSRLVAGVLALLAWQVVSTAAAPLALCYAQALADSELQCTCPDTAGATCPLHHPHGAQTSNSPSGPRWCDGCPGVDESILTLIGGPLGVPPITLTLITPNPASAASWTVSARLNSLDTPPFSPPPRD